MLCIGGSQIPFGWSFLSIARVPMAWSPGDVWTAELDLPLGVRFPFFFFRVFFSLRVFVFEFFFLLFLTFLFLFLFSLPLFQNTPKKSNNKKARVEYKYVILEEQDWTKHESADAEGIVSRQSISLFSLFPFLFFEGREREKNDSQKMTSSTKKKKKNAGRVRVPQPGRRGRRRRPGRRPHPAKDGDRRLATGSQQSRAGPFGGRGGGLGEGGASRGEGAREGSCESGGTSRGVQAEDAGDACVWSEGRRGGRAYAARWRWWEGRDDDEQQRRQRRQ